MDNLKRILLNKVTPNQHQREQYKSELEDTRFYPSFQLNLEDEKGKKLCGLKGNLPISVCGGDYPLPRDVPVGILIPDHAPMFLMRPARDAVLLDSRVRLFKVALRLTLKMNRFMWIDNRHWKYNQIIVKISAFVLLKRTLKLNKRIRTLMTLL